MDRIQQRALETWYAKKHPLYDSLFPPTLGLVGEAGEFADLVKKDAFKPGFVANPEQFLDELGDVLFYLAVLANYFGVTLDELSRKNYKKLNGRESRGKGYNRGEG